MARYIDADALVQKIVNTPTHAIDDIIFCHPDALTGLANRQNEIIDMIDEMPTADVAPVRHGEWLNFYGDYSNAECSQCGYQFEVIWEDAENVGDSMRKSMLDEFRKCYHYCPNCGARMSGGEEK